MVPEISYTQLQPVIQESLIHSDIEPFAFFRPKIRIGEIRKKQIVNRRGAKSGRIASSHLRARLFQQVTAGDTIRGGVSEDVIRILPNAARKQDPLVEIELRLCKPRV